jgi:hypothetical protein
MCCAAEVEYVQVKVILYINNIFPYTLHFQDKSELRASYAKFQDFVIKYEAFALLEFCAVSVDE